MKKSIPDAEAAFQLGLLDSETVISGRPKRRKKVLGKRLPTLRSATDLITWVTDGAYTHKVMKLFDDVGQVYELLLARMEFSTLGGDLALFAERSAYFEEVEGHKTLHYYLSAVKGKGQIGHSNQYLTHWFYPYKGKYHGQMIKALINFMGVKGDGLILDPFVGSGTTLVECATLGIPSIGIDINPALCIVSQIKTDSLSIDYPELARWLSKHKPLDIFNYFFGQVREKRA
ncbi:site-specific DNA-methyltransferase [Dehalococcoidales bacterium]|nr:site-specific DNA-methyltransferase [Dehalococcoidales bacterium]